MKINKPGKLATILALATCFLPASMAAEQPKADRVKPENKQLIELVKKHPQTKHFDIVGDKYRINGKPLEGHGKRYDLSLELPAKDMRITYIDMNYDGVDEKDILDIFVDYDTEPREATGFDLGPITVAWETSMNFLGSLLPFEAEQIGIRDYGLIGFSSLHEANYAYGLCKKSAGCHPIAENSKENLEENEKERVIFVQNCIRDVKDSLKDKEK